MKVFTVNGITGSGKTTTIENIVRELTSRGYSVGTVKDIHFEGFAIDTPGTNTDRHRNAGSKLVTARGMYETDILYQHRESMENILSQYEFDYVALEGVLDLEVPQILAAHEELSDYEKSELSKRKLNNTIAYSGCISNLLTEYEGIPVFNSKNNIKKFVDFIEKNVADYEPDIGFDFDLDIDCSGTNYSIRTCTPAQKLLIAKAFGKTVTEKKLTDAGYISNNKFISKKNSVYKAYDSKGNPVVIKHCKYRDLALKEADYLRQLRERGVLVPKVIDVFVQAIILEYIEGEPLCDVLEKLESENKDFRKPLDSFALWMKEYYMQKGIPSSIGDINLRNFIITNTNRVFGVDFEPIDNYDKTMENDLGNIKAFMLNYNPPNTKWKQDASDYLLMKMNECFNIDYQLVDDSYKNELERMHQRR